MKLILTDDWHYTDKTPTSRIDNYPSALCFKISQIINKANELQTTILHAGDLTDTPFLSYATYLKLYDVLSYLDTFLYTVYGQHDMRYRTIGNTPLDALNKTLDRFIIIGSDPYHLDEDVYVYGCSYGGEIPQITTEGFNILLIHRMIVSQKEEDWEDPYDEAIPFLKKLDFDLIVSGDNHKSFVHQLKDGRTIVNCGSLMRMNIGQIEHKPFFCVFDTKTKKVEKVYLEIEPWENVFDLEAKVKEEQRNEELESFVSSLKTHKEMGLNFMDNIMNYVKDNNIDLEVALTIKRCANAEDN